MVLEKTDIHKENKQTWIHTSHYKWKFDFKQITALTVKANTTVNLTSLKLKTSTHPKDVIKKVDMHAMGWEKISAKDMCDRFVPRCIKN